MLLDEQKLIRELLQRELDTSRGRNRAYSSRAFAKKIGISSGTLSGILQGKRRVSAQKAQALLKALNLDPEIEAWMAPVLKKSKNLEIRRALIELDRFEVIASPIHLNALNFLRIPKADPTLSGLAKRMRQRAEVIGPVLDRLERVGLVKKQGEKYLPHEHSFATPPSFAHRAARSFHKKTLREAEKKLEEVSVDMRDFSAITIPANPETLPEVRELIKKFRDEVCHLLSRGDRPEVYKLCVQLYPVALEEKP